MRNLSMRLIRLACVIIPIVSMSPSWAQSPSAARAQRGGQARPSRSADSSSGETKAVTQAILDDIDKHSELMANLEYLCDMIGPRLTGSPALAKANQWTSDKFRQYGLANAHLEPWKIAKGWTRGEAKGRIIARSNNASSSNRPAGALPPRAPNAAL